MRQGATTTMNTQTRGKLAAAGLALGTVAFIWPTSVSAHVNRSSATCDGLHAWAENYNANDLNTITVTLGGDVLVSTTFGRGYEATFDVPQDGQAYAWSVQVDSSDNEWDSTNTGEVGPCGQPPTTLPATTIPDTTLPATTLPATTLPDTTVPATTTPETPPSTSPSTTSPSTTTPETTQPTPSTSEPSTSTSTTTPPSSSSSVPSSTTTPTSGPPSSDGPKTTPPRDAPPTGGQSLPRTGGKTGAQLALAAGLMCAGVALWAIGRKRA